MERKTLRQRVAAWIARNLIADDPYKGEDLLSRLDRADGLGAQDSAAYARMMEDRHDAEQARRRQASA